MSLRAAVRGARGVGVRAGSLGQRRWLSIPVSHIVRGMEFAVEDEQAAELADSVAAVLSAALKEELGEGYDGYNRLVCKAEWDYKVFYEFASPEAFGQFKQEGGKPLELFNSAVKDMEAIAKGNVHTQNFVFDKKK